MGLILASGSPPRRELLSLLGVPFRVLSPNIDESPQAGEAVEDTVLRLASDKATCVAAGTPDAAVLAADTLVELDGVALGKPNSPKAARSYLRALWGRTHRVCSGVCLSMGDGGAVSLVTTQVRMRRYTDAEIERSVAAGTPFDKAGAYAIQDKAFHPVESIDGCYCSVMGLPLWPVYELLRSTEHAARARPPGIGRPACAACPLRP